MKEDSDEEMRQQIGKRENVGGLFTKEEEGERSRRIWGKWKREAPPITRKIGNIRHSFHKKPKLGV